MNRKLLLSNVAVVVLFVLGLTYLLVYVVRINPLAQPFTVTVNLSNSGGLLDHSQVTYRGYPVGKVERIRLRPGGVAVDLRINDGTRIPKDTEAVVANLSAAGEQYVDFKPRSDTAPYLTEGDVIEERHTAIPVSFAQLMSNVEKLTREFDAHNLNVIVDELAAGFGGTGQAMREMVDGSDTLLATLQDTLPQTTRLLDNGKVVLDTAVELREDLGRFSRNVRTLAAQLRSSDPTVRQLLDETPAAMSDVDQFLVELQPSFTALLTDLVPISDTVRARTPAIGTYLPDLQLLAEALSTVFWGGGAHGIADVEPRKTCDYGTPRRPATDVVTGGPYLYRYCTILDPRIQQRGAYNAPRPPGDETAHAPSGVTGTERLGRQE